MSDPANTATVAIRVERDRSAATLAIPRALGGEVLDVAEIERLASEEGVRVDEEVTRRIEDAIARFQCCPGDVEEVIAAARASVDGTDGRLEWAEGFEPTDGCVPGDAGEGSGKVDYYNCKSFIQVRADVHIATIHEPTAGEAGQDVSGSPLRATPGRPCDVRVDPSLIVRTDGRVLARFDGLLEYKGNEIRVTPVFQVDGSVDFSTGNIDFEGSVTIGEDVRDRFRVKAAENIVVKGLVQAAMLVCGGDLVCKQGMAARDRGTIDVGGNADVGYLEIVHGAIKGDLKVQRSLVHCHLAVGGDLLGAEVAVIGGSISVEGTVEVGRIGSDAATITIFSTPAPRGQSAVHVKKRIFRGAIILLGDCVIEFEHDVSGPVTLGRNDEGDPFIRSKGGTELNLGNVARIVRTAA